MSVLGLLLMPVSGILQLIALAQIFSLNFGGAVVCGGWGVCLGVIGVALIGAGEKASERRLNKVLEQLDRTAQ